MDDVGSLVREAELLFSQRDWDEALDKYAKIMVFDPQNEEACEKLARVYAIRGLISKVIETYFQLIDILEGKGELDLSIEVARWIMRLQPESDKARMRTIQIYMQKGDREEVMRQSLELARLYIELGQGEQSIDLLKNAQEMDPNNLEIGIELAEMYIRDGHIPEGAAQFRKIANIYLDQNNLEKAADAFKRLKLIQPDDPALLFTLGNVYVNLGRLNDAEAEFRSILRHDLNHLEALMSLGMVCQQKGQFRDAILAFNKILSINPQEISAKEKLGELYQAQGNSNEAIKNYLSAAHSYQFVEEEDKAIRLYQRVVVLDPTNPTACRELTNMGAALVAEGGDEPSVYAPAIGHIGGTEVPAGAPDQPGMPEEPVFTSMDVMPPGVAPIDDGGDDQFAPLTAPAPSATGSRKSGGLVAKGGGADTGGGKAMLPRPGMMTPRGAGLVAKSEGASAGGAKPRLGGGEGGGRPMLARSRTSEVSGGKPQLIRGRDVEPEPIDAALMPSPFADPGLSAPPVPEPEAPVQDYEEYQPPPPPAELSTPPETFDVPTFDPSLLSPEPPPLPPTPEPVFPAFDEVPEMPVGFADEAPPLPDADFSSETVADLAAETSPDSAPTPRGGGLRKRQGPEIPPDIPPELPADSSGGGPRLFSRGGGSGLGKRNRPGGLRAPFGGSRSDADEDAPPVDMPSIDETVVDELPPVESAPEPVHEAPLEPVYEAPPEPAFEGAPEEPEAAPTYESEPVEAAVEPEAPPVEEPVESAEQPPEPEVPAEQPVASPAPAATGTAEPSFEAHRLEEYLGSNDLNRAILAFRKTLQENPADTGLRARLADLLFQHGMVDEAAVEYMTIATTDTDNPAILHRLAETYLWSDAPDNAIRLLIHLSYMHRQRGEFDSAFQVLQDALVVARENPEARFELADLYGQQEQQELANWHLRVMADIADEHNDATVAVETYRKLFGMTGDPHDQERLAQILEKFGQVEEAVAEYRSLAQRYVSDGSDHKARQVFERITALAPQDVASHEALLELYRQAGDEAATLEQIRVLAGVTRHVGDLDRSAQLQEELVKRQPEDVEARQVLVQLYLDRGRMEEARTEAHGLLEAWYKENRIAEAVELLGRFVAAAPEDIAIREQLILFHEKGQDSDAALRERLNLAQVYLAKGARDEALKVYQKALTLDENNSEVHYQLGLMFADHLGDPAEAENRFLKVKELEPTHNEAMTRLVHLQLKLNKPREAITTLNDLIKIDSGNAAIRDTILADYKARVQANADDANSRFTLGVMYKELGLLDHAIEQFQETRKVRDLMLASYNMLGQCFALKKGFNMLDLAIKQFRKGLEQKGYRDEEYQELRFHLAELHNQKNEVEEALKLYEDVYSIDINYRDVADRIRQIKAEQEGGGKITRLPQRSPNPPQPPADPKAQEESGG
ncbi:MAG: tetratricopeptide repeat protein [Armatimonadetes bacterium]|nr:tetratricopeptide repeat protein [Armatimonadota bacterium]